MSAPQPATLSAARWIPLAMALGVVALSVGACVLRATGTIPADEGLGRTLALVVLALVLGAVPAYLAVRKVLLERARAAREPGRELLRQGRVPPPLLALTIVGAALAEGVGLFGAITVLLGGPWVVLAAPVLAAGLILMQIPRRERLEELLRGD